MMASDVQQPRVGYCSPPAANKFKPGQSGNRKGRPKGSRNLDSIVRDQLERQVTIKEGGPIRKIASLRSDRSAGRQQGGEWRPQSL